MRYTKNHCGVYVIPKDLLQEATKKLARLENIKEANTIAFYPVIITVRRAARENERLYPAIASLLDQAADIIIAAADRQQCEEAKWKRVLDFLDRIDGDITIDDPISTIREFIENI